MSQFEIQKSKKTKTTSIVAAIVLVIVALACVSGTIAYIVKNTNSVENTFKSAQSGTPEIIEDFKDGDTVKKNVKVKVNGGDGSYFVRAAVVITLQDENGNTVAKVPAQDVDYTIAMGSNWTKNGNYWYYNSSVGAGKQTNVLIDTCTTLNSEYHLAVDVVAQTIQANPIGAVQAEWGYVPGNSN